MKEESKRSRVGYGTTYQKSHGDDAGYEDGIRTVLGGQVWMIKPDKQNEIVNPCLWMAAGVIKSKDCTNFYDCTTCKYDAGLVKTVAKGKRISWQDAMRKRGTLDRVCRHSLTGRIDQRVCAYDYQCVDCDFDQYFEEVYQQKNSVRTLQYSKGEGIRYACRLLFSQRSHLGTDRKWGEYSNWLGRLFSKVVGKSRRSGFAADGKRA